MRDKAVPPYVAVIVIAVIALIAGFFLWRAGSVGTEEGGKPTPKDLQLLKRMQEVREQAGAGRTLPAGKEKGQAAPP
ncbi:MAG TPA: hypothetical protein VFB21_16625 [Chthonomonadaceae bacterium]|jgi:hypothetical protein|nr:hypothetical protein [Chthonomonadaceae bacterium]